MKNGVAILLFLVAGSLSFAGDLQVNVTRKRVDAKAKVNTFNGNKKTNAAEINPGVKTNKTEIVQYAVNVANNTLATKPALEARYIVFVERQKPGSRREADTVEKITGSTKLEELKPRASASFTTTEIKLRESSLSGNWIYSNGGRLKTTDNLVGIWIKFFDGDQQVDEFANPTTLTTRHGWTE